MRQSSINEAPVNFMAVLWVMSMLKLLGARRRCLLKVIHLKNSICQVRNVACLNVTFKGISLDYFAKLFHWKLETSLIIPIVIICVEHIIRKTLQVTVYQKIILVTNMGTLCSPVFVSFYVFARSSDRFRQLCDTVVFVDCFLSGWTHLNFANRSTWWKVGGVLSMINLCGPKWWLRQWPNSKGEQAISSIKLQQIRQQIHALPNERPKDF